MSSPRLASVLSRPTFIVVRYVALLISRLINKLWRFSVIIIHCLCGHVTDFIVSSNLPLMKSDANIPEVAIDREEAGHLRQGLDFQGAVNDIAACVEYLLSKGCAKVGVVGFWYASSNHR